MRRALVMLVLAADTARATPPVTPPAPTDAFDTYCAARAPRATCLCVTNTLQRTSEGQIALEAFELRQRYGTAIPKDVGLKLLNRYNLRTSELETMAPKATELAKSSIAACR